MAGALITPDNVRAALSLASFDAAAAQKPMIPGTRLNITRKPNSRQAGVLVLLYPQHEELHFVLTRRTETLRGHSGQISFPGGKRDPDDKTFVDTALRETCEELGVCADALREITVLGQLSTLYIPPSNFEVFPVVAALTQPPVFQPNPAEVAQVFSVPLAALLDNRYKQSEYWDFNGQQVLIPYYAFHDQIVWGATAIMLSELEGRLRAALPETVLQALQ
jgi:8-oxo-dGTP pyrophosphatase MutT (NUDIX family)